MSNVRLHLFIHLLGAYFRLSLVNEFSFPMNFILSQIVFKNCLVNDNSIFNSCLNKLNLFINCSYQTNLTKQYRRYIYLQKSISSSSR